MKKHLWYIFLGLLLLLVVYSVSQSIYAHFVLQNIDRENLDSESKIWIDNVMPKILDSWDTNEIVLNSSPEFLGVSPTDETKRFSDWALENYGELKRYVSSSGEAGIHIINFSTTITAEYVVDAEFAKRQGRVFVQGIKRDGVWKIYSLHLDDNPDLRWFNGQLTDQPPLDEPGVQFINGIFYFKW